MNAAFLNDGLSDSVHSWEVQLVLEYCDQGSLRALLNKQGMFAQTGRHALHSPSPVGSGDGGKSSKQMGPLAGIPV